MKSARDSSPETTGTIDNSGSGTGSGSMGADMLTDGSGQWLANLATGDSTRTLPSSIGPQNALTLVFVTFLLFSPLNL